ncbi:unnamed protein product [Ceutorhynchus assimilis]|uniref:protein-histidine N-methyltransferase n=1 Tax=Ceutorhynchus assimilis TaxID=467358 RepID=A0A9N9MQP1_9CUCU|nr:unnamed protein product [Ceutorhynchus assimilis]
MFKFNFSNENNKTKEEEILPPNTTWLESKKIEPNEDDDVLKDIFNNCEENSLDCKDVNIKYFSTVDVLNILKTNEDWASSEKLSVLSADQNHSDLQTAVYEGGLKIWECTYDLISYMVDENLNLNNKNVLDLGCGAGLIGLLCLAKGSSCTFQDYNAEILKYITIPNVRLNGEEDYLSKSSFHSGDWESFTDLIGIEKDEDKFDYIFTSETIYNAENYGKLHELFERLLKKDGEMYPYDRFYIISC